MSAQHVRPRWYWLYFVLAAFDLLTLSFSLYLNHRLRETYTESIQVNQKWAARLNRYADLTQLAGSVNAPGNDVFDSQDPAGESERLKMALENFNRAFAAAQDDLAGLEPGESEPLLSVLAQVRLAMDEMTDQAGRIFREFRHRRRAAAGAHMASMDRKYARLGGVFFGLNQAVREIQKAKFAAQESLATVLHRFEVLIASCIALIVVGVTLYGYKMARSMMAFNETLERKVSQRTAEGQRLVKKLRALTAELFLTEERERRQLAADLHDDLAQRLALIRIKLTDISRGRDSSDERAGEALREVKGLVDQADEQVRSLTFQLSPPMLEQFGLMPALEWQAEEMARHYRLHVDIEGQTDPILLDPHLLFGLFRCVRELLINAAKHAQTDRAQVHLSWQPDRVQIEVEDKGQGFEVSRLDTDAEGSGFGLFSLRERIENLGGRLSILSLPGEGTTATLWIPLAPLPRGQ